MKLTEIYRQILKALCITAGPEDLLSYEAIDGSQPLTVKDEGKEKRLALPTRQILDSGNWDQIVAFHPLSEHLNRGTSPVMNTLVKIGMFRLTEVMSSLMMQLVELAADKKRHAGMSPKSQQILSVLKDVDKQTVENLSQILRRIDMSPQKRLVSIFLKRKGVYKGVTSRVCVVNFPLYSELSNPDRKVWGVQLRKKDVEALESLFEYILPDLDNTEAYSAPSDSKVAPYFESFLDAYEKVASQLNRVIHNNRKELDLVDKLKSVMWENVSDDLLAHRSDIPPLDGNKGVSLDDSSLTGNETATATTVSAPARSPLAVSAAAAVAPTVTAPVMTPAVVTSAPANTSLVGAAVTTSAPEESMSEKIARRQRQMGVNNMPAMGGGYGAAPMMQPMGYNTAPQLPNCVAPNPFQTQQQMQPPQVQLVNTPNGQMYVMMTPNGPIPVVPGPNGAWMPMNAMPGMAPGMAMMPGMQMMQAVPNANMAVGMPPWMGNESGTAIVAATPTNVGMGYGNQMGMMGNVGGVGLVGAA